MTGRVVPLQTARIGHDLDPDEAVFIEIERMHQFIAAWFRGECEQAAFQQGLADGFHPDFVRVAPSGRQMFRDELVDMLAEANGTSPFFRIRTEEIRVIARYPDFLVAGYVEHQSGARNSEQVNRRRATVIFEPGPRLRWRYLHETTVTG